MKSDLFSKGTVRFLENNGYKVQHKGSTIHFKKFTSDFNIAFLGCLAIVVPIVLALYNVYIGAGVFLAIILLGFFGRNSFFERKLLIDLNDSKFLVPGSFGWTPINRISEIYIHSKFIDEYTSAFKSTSQEFHTKLGIRLDSGYRFSPFLFKTDYSEPGKEINELHDWLEELIKKSRE